MTTRLILLVFLSQGLVEVRGWWCFYFCPDSYHEETVCGVDDKLGAKLFRGKCQMWKNNYCQETDYELLEIQECLDRHPEVLFTLLASKGGVKRFNSLNPNLGVRPFQRFLMLFSLISRLAPPPPLPIGAWPAQYNPYIQASQWPTNTNTR